MALESYVVSFESGRENGGASVTSETKFVAALNENIYFLKLLAGSVKTCIVSALPFVSLSKTHAA